ncbi:hypothetical protein J7I93_09035 [Bacillus sp. ISL-47]|uniref:UPF0738 family protein n=1 Tax=Bacillus sp. ISL-47 TaxID=2819130 RepID=UPI001BE919F5|nr:hypothetical protein [Bacillus sp. ISL-47]MBT2688324.1 hypothetical protein [Bacillus sp. ISL-47]MBT2710117.1 hypothetical protein [Pseudomonas sp. ISL-84]
MKQKLTVTKAEMKENGLFLEVEDGSVSGLKATEQILADSDNLSFIYIADNNEDYTYISLPESVWPELKNAYDARLPVYVTDQRDQLLLKGFHEEIGDLIENIRGNSNYGEEMVAKVESIF